MHMQDLKWVKSQAHLCVAAWVLILSVGGSHLLTRVVYRSTDSSEPNVLNSAYLDPGSEQYSSSPKSPKK